MYKRIISTAVLAIMAGQAHAGYWVSGNGLSSCGQKAYKLLRNADHDGLDQKDFNPYLAKINGFRKGQMSAAQAESAFNAGMKNYVDDVRNGRFNPKLADKQLVMKPEPVNAGSVVSQGVSSGSCLWMENQAPPYREYRILKKIHKKYRALEKKGTWPTIKGQGKLVLGHSNSQVSQARKALAQLGDLHPSQADDGNTFDQNLKDAVKRFQRRHGLKADGFIGGKTKKAINRTPSDRLNQINVTMERWRWMPRNPGRRHVKVNIAGFMLEAVANGKVSFTSPIIIGTAYRETPVFSSRMTNVKFNPSWSVPYNLAVSDKLPKLKRNGGALGSNFVVTNRSGKAVNPRNINWARYSSGNFPFSLRQRPGNKNALGKIRFTIHHGNIFLHSTPHKHLFKKANRAFSSGCIRVQKIHELAQFALNKPEWSYASVDGMMQNNKTKIIPMKENLPVHITYFTVWVDQRGTPHFMEDIYGQDAQVSRVMQQH